MNVTVVLKLPPATKLVDVCRGNLPVLSLLNQLLGSGKGKAEVFEVVSLTEEFVTL